MADKYQICFIKPPDYDGSLVFREVLFLLRNSLVSLGYDCLIKPNQMAEDRINILIGYHLLQYGDYLKNYRYIPFQLEQLDSGNPWYSDNVQQILAAAEDIWDFSEINLTFLADQGLMAKQVKIGYHPGLEIIPHAGERDIDVLFYGSINERRKELLEDLSEKAGVKVLQGVFGAERDEMIGRSKIVLNMHYYPTRILESVRISYLLNNRSFVISEDAADNPYDEVELVTAPYEKLIHRCHYFLRRPAELEAIREKTSEQFKKIYPMTEILERAL